MGLSVPQVASVMGFGYEGKRIRLVPLDADKHLENLYLWMNDSDVTDTLGFPGTPLTRGQERDFIDKAGSDPKHVIFAIETLDGVHIGTTGIHDINRANGTAGTGSYIGPAEYRGKGYGTEASILRAKYAFEVLGLRILKSYLLGGNIASQRMMEKTGYLVYGRVENEHWKNGAYHDTVYTVLTREKFKELHG
jgi:RimJ/RimL family protein N-acetyltransferase